MKDKLIKSLSRKQLEKACRALNERDEGARARLEARISEHSYKMILAAVYNK